MPNLFWVPILALTCMLLHGVVRNTDSIILAGYGHRPVWRYSFIDILFRLDVASKLRSNIGKRREVCKLKWRGTPWELMARLQQLIIVWLQRLRMTDARHIRWLADLNWLVNSLLVELFRLILSSICLLTKLSLRWVLGLETELLAWGIVVEMVWSGLYRLLLLRHLLVWIPSLLGSRRERHHPEALLVYSFLIRNRVSLIGVLECLFRPFSLAHFWSWDAFFKFAYHHLARWFSLWTQHTSVHFLILLNGYLMT